MGFLLKSLKFRFSEDMNPKEEEEEILETPNTSMQDMQRKAQKCLSTGRQIKSDKKQKALHLNAKLTGTAKEAKRSIGLSPQTKWEIH